MQDLLQQYMMNNARLKRLMTARFNGVIDTVGLSPAQSETLILLLRSGHPRTAKDLADDLMLSPGAISQQLDTLEQLGCIKRVRAETDRRQSAVTICNDDAKVLHLRAFLAEITTEISRAINAEEITTLITIQKKLLGVLTVKPKGENL